MYAYILIFCEFLKGRNECKPKWLWRLGLIRYYILSCVENIIVRLIPLSICKLNQKSRNDKIVISLTTFPARINACFFTLKSLLMQTMRPDRVVLWLAEEQFPNHKLPIRYDKLIAKGVEVRFCKDLRSHKKYYYMLQEQQPDELVLTFDDDIIYNPLSVERAYKKHLQYPNAIVPNETKNIRLDKKGRIMPYNTWVKVHDGEKHPSIMNSVMSGSGCLYPYGIWPKQMFDITLHQRLAPTADDMWITFYAIHCNIPIVCVDTPARTYTTVSSSQKEHLGKVNCIGTGNDDTVKNMMEYFPDISKKLYDDIFKTV